MPGVVSVQPRVGSTLGQVAQVAQTAKSIYDIKHESDMADLAQAQAGRQQQAFDDQQNGVVTAKELPFILKNARTVSAETPGAIEQKVRSAPGDEGLSSIYILPKKDQDYRPVQDYVNAQGQHGTAFIDLNNPTEGPVGFAQTAKPQKELTPHYSQTVLDNGNVGAFDTTTGGVIDTGAAAGAKPGKPVDQGAVDQKATDKAEKVYSQVGEKMVQPGRNKAVQQAMVNQLAADQALKLAGKYQGNYNNMNDKDYALFIGELGKISTGGVASQHSQEALTANTLESKWKSFVQQVGGHPTGAQLGEFIQGNVDYLKDLNETASQHIANYQSAIWKSYKNQLPPELQARFQAEFADQPLFRGQHPAEVAQQAAATANGGGLVGTANAGQGGGGHPQDAQAVAWANQNILSKDPSTAAQARQILQLNGAK